MGSDKFLESYPSDMQIQCWPTGRKFRDEARPRAGLLRGREFLMKDLYTFDASEEQAAVTYEDVKNAYVRIFDRLGLPYSVVSLVSNVPAPTAA